MVFSLLSLKYMIKKSSGSLFGAEIDAEQAVAMHMQQNIEKSIQRLIDLPRCMTPEQSFTNQMKLEVERQPRHWPRIHKQGIPRCHRLQPKQIPTI